MIMIQRTKIPNEVGANAPTSVNPSSRSAIAGAAIAAGVTALGSWLGQSQTNKQNAAQSEKSRIWQSQENRKAEQFQERMWNEQNVYNTPSETRKRLEEAGYNPWMSGSGSPASIGAAGSAGSGSSTGAPSPIPMQNALGPAVQNGVATYMGLQANKANIANQNAQTIKQASEAYTEYLKATGDYKGGQKLLKTLLAGVNRSDKDISDLTNSLNYGFIREKLAADRESVQYEIESLYGKEKARLENKNLEKGIEYLDGQISQIKSLKNLTDQQLNESVERTAKMLEEKLTIKESREFIIRKLEAEVKILEADPMANGTFASMEKGMPILAKFLSLLLKALK